MKNTPIEELENLLENDIRTRSKIMYNERDTWLENTLYVELDTDKHVVTIEANNDTKTFRLEVRHFRLQKESALKEVNSISKVLTYIRHYDKMDEVLKYGR